MQAIYAKFKTNNNLNKTTAHVNIFTMQVESVMYLLCDQSDYRFSFVKGFRSLFKASLVRFLLYTRKCFYIFLIIAVCLLFINNFDFTIPNKYKNNRFDLHQKVRLWPSQWNVVFYEDTYIFSSIHDHVFMITSTFSSMLMMNT